MGEENEKTKKKSVSGERQAADNEYNSCIYFLQSSFVEANEKRRKISLVWWEFQRISRFVMIIVDFLEKRGFRLFVLMSPVHFLKQEKVL
uniref:hypothetical protein n=1 Tax=Salmonella sp. s58408 TaxID=3159701 RepID=UPI00397FFC99